MKQYSKVVILNNPGKGNIEQAIFILKKELPEKNEDYILEEAKRIVEDFAVKSGLAPSRTLKKGGFFVSAVVSLLVLGYFIYKFM